ncbi:ryncolin-4-like [Haliotis rufescens]|uniref:ryncolin-4-like n=1 Tax=Haliotis rufescens TaxID=6454 RepID=UPI00201FA3D1|nr:ryncolin-4-like [Haliotis rufescens]
MIHFYGHGIFICIQVIQNRYDGSEGFDRTWNEYKEGFGDLDKEFWLGNEKIWRMTREALFQLLIQIMDFENTKSKAYYHRFSVGNSSVNYALQFGWYNGNAGNGLEYHQGRPFSARDLDLDASSTHCADLSGGGWWYGACYEVNLNGLYSTAGGNLSWLSLGPLKRTQMKITPYI